MSNMAEKSLTYSSADKIYSQQMLYQHFTSKIWKKVRKNYCRRSNKFEDYTQEINDGKSKAMPKDQWIHCNMYKGRNFKIFNI